MVTVIIPIYNVEEYLAECLDSVVQQTYRNLEIIIIDDGSPDGSHDIAASYARWDPRIRIIRQANAGLGAARNTGIRNAHGKFLTFADSDDTLPKDAIARMVRSLHKTKSDFVVGAPMRMANGRTWVSGWVKDVHATNRERVRLDDFPDILKNVFAWNKLFDADFFRRVVGEFPEGIRYEDQEPTAKAYVAGTFDVLSATVYNWRDREDGTSITQQKSDPNDLHDRLLVKKAVGDVISAGASRTTHELWLAKAIGFDLRSYFEEVPRTDQAYFDQLRRGVLALERRMTDAIWRQVPIIDRIPALAVLANEPDDVGAAVTQREEYGWFIPAELRADGVYLQRTCIRDLNTIVPDALLELGPVDLKVRAMATSLWWHGSTLRLEGYAYIGNLPYDPEHMTTLVELVSRNGKRVGLDSWQHPCPRLDWETKDSWNSHWHAGFVVEIDPTTLPIGASAPWSIEITVKLSNGYSQTAPLRDCDVRGIAGTRPVAPALGRVRWIAGFEEGKGFQLRHTSALEVPIADIQDDGQTLRITVGDPDAKALLLSCSSLRRKIEIAGTRRASPEGVSFRVALPPLNAPDDVSVEHAWSVRVRNSTGEYRRLTYLGSSDDLSADSPEHHQVRVTMTRAGTIRLLQNRWWAVVDDVTIGNDTLTITGRISAPETACLTGRMVSSSHAIGSQVANFDPSDQRFTLGFPVGGEGSTPTTRHGYSVRMTADFDGRQQERWLRVANDLQHSFPCDSPARHYGVTLTRTRRAGALWVRFRPPYSDNERGRLSQRRMHDQFRRPLSVGGRITPQPTHSALFESFNGRSITDSTLAIFTELRDRNTNLNLLWTVGDLQTPVPDGATPVLIHSEAYMEALHNSRYLINNSNFPFYYRKRRDQIYIQTWHGTPLKKIGNDVPAANLSLSYRRLMSRESTYWDFLLAQNKFAADTLPTAFGYDGPVLNLGYPRNDVLASADRELRRKHARADLGILDDQLCVLYAPTWRDNLSVATGYGMVSHLDYQLLRNSIHGASHIMLRGHSNTAHDTLSVVDADSDMTRYPDVNKLILASDLLITDYSSIMFDYCVTGKPILFLAPDIDEYRNVTRGFYLDFENIAPGPICRSNEELAKVIEELPQIMSQYYSQYAGFVQEFAPQDDGSAARRVVDQIWSLDSID